MKSRPLRVLAPLFAGVACAVALGLGSAQADEVTRHRPVPRPLAQATPRPLAPLPPPPATLVSALRLSPKYVKYMDMGGVPVLGSASVSGYALREASYVVTSMIGHRPDVLAAIAKRGVRLVVMAKTELTTDVPEHADLTPKAYWDRRARGLGATLARPATSAAEENLLELPGDPYATESILVHEIAHTIHQHGVAVVDPTFARRLTAAYAHARAAGLWAGTYAGTNEDEYWAEATQSWFDTNRANDAEHGPIDTRAKLVAYDREVAALLREVYGDGTWRYVRPSQRSAEGRAHLAGFDPRAAGAFAWPAAAPALLFANHRAGEIAVDWIDFGGGRRRYFVLRPGATQVQATFVGHAWAISDERGQLLGGVVAGAPDSRVDVR